MLLPPTYRPTPHAPGGSRRPRAGRRGHVRRSGEFRALAEEQADFEAGSLEYADDARGERGDPQRVARGEQMAAYHRALKAQFSLALASWCMYLGKERDL